MAISWPWWSSIISGKKCTLLPACKTHRTVKTVWTERKKEYLRNNHNKLQCDSTRGKCAVLLMIGCRGEKHLYLWKKWNLWGNLWVLVLTGLWQQRCRCSACLCFSSSSEALWMLNGNCGGVAASCGVDTWKFHPSPTSVSFSSQPSLCFVTQQNLYLIISLSLLLCDVLLVCLYVLLSPCTCCREVWKLSFVRQPRTIWKGTAE